MDVSHFRYAEEICIGPCKNESLNTHFAPENDKDPNAFSKDTELFKNK